MRTEKGERHTLADREMTWVGKALILLLPPSGPATLARWLPALGLSLGPWYMVCVSTDVYMMRGRA